MHWEAQGLVCVFVTFLQAHECVYLACRRTRNFSFGLYLGIAGNIQIDLIRIFISQDGLKTGLTWALKRVHQLEAQEWQN